MFNNNKKKLTIATKKVLKNSIIFKIIMNNLKNWYFKIKFTNIKPYNL